MRLRSLFTVLFAGLATAAALSLIAVLDATLRQAVEDRVAERIVREIDHLSQDLRGLPPDLLDEFLRRSAQELACRITLILPRHIGDAFVMRDASAEELRRFLAETG